ncbi:helicase UvrD [Ectopseudomonas composti]|jgi:DNA helicase-2/ATP-dependent DNA helicase PcrA|uniref:DNA 3'-5' helicase II n=1 Tax=Ectopseudomonas composti TaxID=658457 RepID=A0ABN0S9K5_9GAMM|nr:helicase UvrD [Pseudomonas composti]EZH78842.1 helicase UvrD [Pseudomonas composti]
MDKSVIFSVAGSGKTSLVIDRLSLDQRALIITYTDNNHRHLRNRIIQKFGVIPSSITLMTYFSFLHGFCYRPLMQLQLGTRGLNFRRPPDRRLALTEINRYRDGSRRLYHNRLAKLLEVKGCLPAVRARLERFYDCLYVDEVQDFAGHDFNLLLQVSQANIGMTFVGDFHQHTFDTSRDGTVNGSLHDDIAQYEKRFRDAGITVDKTTLGRSWRCGTTVCDFISTKLQIVMGAHDERVCEIITVNDQDQANALHADASIVKLFLQEHSKYGCHSENWGASKGIDHFQDVCVVMGTDIWKRYLAGTLHEANPHTRNKLYVACSRARGDLYFVPDKLLKAFKQQS